MTVAKEKNLKARAATNTSAGKAKQRERLKEIPLFADANSSLKETLNRCQPAPARQEPKPSWEKEEGSEEKAPPNVSSLRGKQLFPSLQRATALGKEAPEPAGVAGWELGGEGLGPEANWQPRLGGYIPSSSINNQPVSIALISLSRFVFFLLFI